MPRKSQWFQHLPQIVEDLSALDVPVVETIETRTTPTRAWLGVAGRLSTIAGHPFENS